MEEESKIIYVPADAEGNTTGYAYDLYVPAGVDANTPVHLYVPGAGGSGSANSADTRALKKYLNETGSQSIVIMPRWNGVSSRDHSKYANEILTISDAVIEKYGAKISISYNLNNFRATAPPITCPIVHRPLPRPPP